MITGASRSPVLSSSSKYADGSSSSRCTAVTIKAWRARVTATCSRRRSSSASAPAAMRSSSRRAKSPWRSRSTSLSLPSNELRWRKFGHTPSCSPATATTSHWRPFAECTVRISTTSGRTPCAVMMSPTIDSRDSSSRNADGLEYGKRSEKRCAESKSWIIASRSRSAAAPRLPPRSAILRQAVLNFSLSLVFALSQIAHNKSSGRASFLVKTLRATRRSS